MAAEKIILKDNANIKFNNNVDFCVGTGRTGLATSFLWYRRR